MAIPNETSTVSEKVEIPAQSSKKPKVVRKPGASGRAQIAMASKRLVTRRAPLEILFTQEANPMREPVPPYIWIDFPTQNEILKAPIYVMRLGVGGADLVELSIDKSPWLPCRLTAGYWWYDWSAIAKGKHTIVARMRTPDGRWFKTPPRLCNYPSE